MLPDAKVGGMLRALRSTLLRLEIFWILTKVDRIWGKCAGRGPVYPGSPSAFGDVLDFDKR